MGYCELDLFCYNQNKMELSTFTNVDYGSQVRFYRKHNCSENNEISPLNSGVKNTI